ncbi:MAG TPA: hypothetical protein VM489_01300 [Burkholderiales bacterium]|nr:hypothetical protein [Burkholderiales bacterium]
MTHIKTTLLLLALLALAIGVWGGLARLSPIPAPSAAAALHGPLLVSAFFGALLGVARAAELGSPGWAWSAPAAAVLGGAVALAGFALAGLVLMLVAALALCAASIVLVQRQRSLQAALIAAVGLASALAWALGNLAALEGRPAVPWWMAFVVLSLGAERPGRTGESAPARAALVVLAAAALLAAALAPRLLGALFAAMALWLAVFHPARAGLSAPGAPRFAALCLLGAAAWLAFGGALVAAARAYDAALHAVFVGFAAPLLFARAPYHGAHYLPLGLLHASLAVRVFIDVAAGAWGNAAAIALFIVTAAAGVLARRRRRLM